MWAEIASLTLSDDSSFPADSSHTSGSLNGADWPKENLASVEGSKYSKNSPVTSGRFSNLRGRYLGNFTDVKPKASESS